uniref:Profilin n=1 Tax=Arcella intermedia TaxID=1963864 RepID=A0A6B2LRF0_9EUKA
MSWQSYVDDQLVATGLANALIMGHDGHLWATSKDFGLLPGEGPAIAAVFKNPGLLFSNGMTVNGVRYLGIKGDERSAYGKRTMGGVVCVKTVQAIIVAVYDEKLQPGQAANTVEKLGDYLLENGF